MNRQEVLDLFDKQFPITEDEVRSKARELWLADGSPNGNDGTAYWLKAEKQLRYLRQQFSQSLLKRFVQPIIQEAAAAVEDEAKRYTSSALNVLQQELLANQQLILPEGVRFHKRIGSIDYLVIEQQPMLRTVPVDMNYHKGRYGADRYGEGASQPRNVRIALPYVVYQITLTNYQQTEFYIGFRNGPLKTLSDPLGMNILPNSHVEGTVCCPFTKSSAKNIVDAVNHIIGFYWQCEFRYCLHHNIPNLPAFKTWDAWEKASAENPLFVLQVPWHKLHYTLADLLKNVATDKLPAPPPAFQDLSSKFIRAASDILSIPMPKVEPVVDELTDAEIGRIVKYDLDQCLENIKKGIWPEGMYHAKS